MDYIVISLIAGAAGGNIGCLLVKDCSLGPTVNAVAGALGGGLGGVILSQVLMPAAATMMMNVGHLGATLGVGLTSGAVFAILLGLVTRLLRK